MGLGRKTKDALRKGRARENETADEKKRRLDAARERQHVARAAETNEQREVRLSKLRANTHSSRISESEEQTSQRLLSMREHARLVRANETEEQRENRLAQMRQGAANKRKVDAELFKATINQFADVPCTLCHKMLYPQQRINLKLTDQIKNLLPPELQHLDKLITCSRCSSNFSKGKVPPQVYWNCMVVPGIPPVIECLSSFEKKLLSRIVPFIKIVRLTDKFSQQWCKGQAILFAQDVEELAEQLPLPFDRAGLVIVAESLENVRARREFSVNMEKLKLALSWLLENNPLYRNVRPSFSDVGMDLADIVRTSNETIMGTFP